MISIFLMLAACNVNADQIGIQLLPNVTLQPPKIVYQTYFPLTFKVTVMNSDNDNLCKGGAAGTQFAITTVYGTQKGINIVPTWGDGSPDDFNIDIYFMNGDTKVDNVTFSGLKLPDATPGQKKYFTITFNQNLVTLVTNTQTAKAINPSYLPDPIYRKYLALSFFQPLQEIPADTRAPDVNKCQFVLEYNGKYVWMPGQPYISGSSPN